MYVTIYLLFFSLFSQTRRPAAITSRVSRKSSNNSRDTFRCQTDVFKFIPRRPHANVAATPRPCFFDVNWLRLIYEPYGYKSPRARVWSALIAR